MYTTISIVIIAYTTFRNTSAQPQFKTDFQQGGVVSPTLFNKYTSDIHTPPNHTKLISRHHHT